MTGKLYYKWYIPILQIITTLLLVAWGVCITGATIYGMNSSVVGIDYTPFTPLLVASAITGGIYSISVLVGIACKW